MYYRVYLSAATAQGSGEQIFLDMKTTPSEREFTLFDSRHHPCKGVLQ